MGYRLQFYRVNLNYLFKALGSKDERLEAQAFSLLEQKLLSSYSKADAKFYSKKGREYLHRLIFDTKASEKHPFKPDFNPNDHQVKAAIATAQSWQTEALLAIFALHPSFEIFGEYGRWRYQEAFEALTESGQLMSQAGKLWKYLLEGRVIGSGINGISKFDYDNYFGYFTNAELALLVEPVTRFYAEISAKPAGEINPEWQTAIKDHFSFIYDVWVENLNKGADLFFYAS
jgi:hypothetical protein